MDDVRLPFLLGCLAPSFALFVLPSFSLYDKGGCSTFKCGTSFSPHTHTATVDIYSFLFTLACVRARRGQAILQWLGAPLLLLSRCSTLTPFLQLLTHLSCTGTAALLESYKTFDEHASARQVLAHAERNVQWTGRQVWCVRVHGRCDIRRAC